MTSVRIPADIDRDDRLLAGLTGRQLLVLAAGVAAVAVVVDGLGGAVPGPVVAAAACPPALVSLAMAFGRVDGLPGDRLAGLGLRWVRRPRRVVPAPAGLPAGLLARRRGVGALELPAEGVGDDGVVDLGPAGSALVCRSSSLNFGLRTPAEQQGLVAAMAAWLNSLSHPVQIVVRAEPVDVGRLVDELEADAPSLPHPDLERAARDHARFLGELAARRDVLRREVLVVFRDPARPGPAVAAGLRRRAEDAASALGAAGLVVARLDEADALATLARSANPDDPMGAAALAWAHDPSVRGAPR